MGHEKASSATTKEHRLVVPLGGKSCCFEYYEKGEKRESFPFITK